MGSFVTRSRLIPPAAKGCVQHKAACRPRRHSPASAPVPAAGYEMHTGCDMNSDSEMCAVIAGSEPLWELLWVSSALSFDTSTVQKAEATEMNMKHQVALSKKTLEGLYILGRKNKIEGQRHFRYEDCVKLCSSSFSLP